MDSHKDPLLGSKPGDGKPDRVEPPIRQRIHALLDEQPFAVLCTQGGGQPYGSVIAYAVGPGLCAVTFATPVATRKYRLPSECGSVALVIDGWCTSPEDMMKVEAITGTGRAVQLDPGPEFDRWAELLIQWHPQPRICIHAPSTGLFRVDVPCCVHVSCFQEVHPWIPEPSPPIR